MQTTISGPVFPFSLSFWRRPWAFSLASLGACVGLAWGPVFLYRRKFMRRLGQHSWDEIEPRSNIYRAEDEEHKEAVLSYMRRCLAAHASGVESYPVYASAILLAIITRVEARVADRLALAYVLLRLLYTIFYIYGSNIVLAKLRTFAWTGSWIITFALYWKSLRRVHFLEQSL